MITIENKTNDIKINSINNKINIKSNNKKIDIKTKKNEITIKEKQKQNLIIIAKKGIQGQKGEQGDTSIIQKEYTAGVNLSSYRAVILGANSKLYYADNTTEPYNILGITKQAIMQNRTGFVVLFGELYIPSGTYEIGKPLFLIDNGKISQTPPTSGALIEIGTAIKQDTILISQKQNILLGA